MNGHFSAVGDKPDDSKYEHGVQVIDEDKEFKYVSLSGDAICRMRRPPS